MGTIIYALCIEQTRHSRLINDTQCLCLYIQYNFVVVASVTCTKFILFERIKISTHLNPISYNFPKMDQRLATARSREMTNFQLVIV